MVLRNCTSTWRIIKVDPFISLNSEFHTKWIKGISLRPKTCHLLPPTHPKLLFFDHVPCIQAGVQLLKPKMTLTLIFLLPPPRCCHKRHAPCLVLCGTGSWTHGYVHLDRPWMSWSVSPAGQCFEGSLKVSSDEVTQHFHPRENLLMENSTESWVWWLNLRISAGQ